MSENRRSLNLLARVFRAVEEDDVEGAGEAVRGDVVYRIPAGTPLGGEHRGMTAFGSVLRKIDDAAGGTFLAGDYTVVVDNGDTVVISEATRNGNGALHHSRYHLYHFVDGQLTEGRMISPTLFVA